MAPEAPTTSEGLTTTRAPFIQQAQAMIAMWTALV